MDSSREGEIVIIIVAVAAIQQRISKIKKSGLGREYFKSRN